MRECGGAQAALVMVASLFPPGQRHFGRRISVGDDLGDAPWSRPPRGAAPRVRCVTGEPRRSVRSGRSRSRGRVGSAGPRPMTEVMAVSVPVSFRSRRASRAGSRSSRGPQARGLVVRAMLGGGERDLEELVEGGERRVGRARRAPRKPAFVWRTVARRRAIVSGAFSTSTGTLLSHRRPRRQRGFGCARRTAGPRGEPSSHAVRTDSSRAGVPWRSASLVASRARRRARRDS